MQLQSRADDDRGLVSDLDFFGNERDGNGVHARYWFGRSGVARAPLGSGDGAG